MTSDRDGLAELLSPLVDVQAARKSLRRRLRAVAVRVEQLADPRVGVRVQASNAERLAVELLALAASAHEIVKADEELNRRAKLVRRASRGS